ncbi:MAG: O-antigen ligase family protein [Pseudomonadota bacterium]
MTLLQPQAFPARPVQRKHQVRIAPVYRDFVVFALWCLVTFVQFRGDQLILYPLAAYYAWAILRDQAKIAPLLARGWVLLLFPAWCLVSPLWAVEPGEAFKNAVYLILTIMICFQVAATMSPRQILHALLLATGVIGVINLIYGFGTGDVRTGIFPQKNAMGKSMVILWVIASAVMLDRGSAWWVRLVALALAMIAAVTAYLSDSATAVLLVLATGMITVAGAIFLLGGLFRASKLAGLFFTIAFIAAVGSFVLPSFETNVVDAVLDHFGKDSTLTGRTVLWSYAEMQIEETPYLGVGAHGYWRYWASPDVQKIFADFNKRSTDFFNFHNSAYEIAVHQGLIGLTLAAITLAWGLLQVTRGAFFIATLPQIFFFTQALAVVVRISTESDFLRPFTLFHMILWIGALSTIRELDARRRASRASADPGRFAA